MNLSSLTVLAITVAGCATASDELVGDWKLNPARSRITDVMKVQTAAKNTYVFDFGGGPETIVADGTDQAGTADTTLAVTIDAPDTWSIVRKKAGAVMVHARWKLSADGNTLGDDYTQLADNGQVAVHGSYQYRRTGGGPGFAGTWEGAIAMPSTQSFTLQVRRSDSGGLSFTYLPVNVIRTIKFDGKDYPVGGTGAAEGATTSSRRLGAHTVQLTDKTKGTITRTSELEVSSDHQTVTQTGHPVGQNAPTIFVFERVTTPAR